MGRGGGGGGRSLQGIIRGNRPFIGSFKEMIFLPQAPCTYGAVQSPPIFRGRSSSPTQESFSSQKRNTAHFDNFSYSISYVSRSPRTQPELIRQVRHSSSTSSSSGHIFVKLSPTSPELGKAETILVYLFPSQVQSWSSDPSRGAVNIKSKSSIPRLSIYHKSTMDK